MKKVAVALFAIILTSSFSFADGNPKLLKEITRKIKLDLSNLKLEKSKDHYVMVQFRVVNGAIDVIDMDSSGEELTELMVCELEDMFINAQTDASTIYQYKFTFEKE